MCLTKSVSTDTLIQQVLAADRDAQIAIAKAIKHNRPKLTSYAKFLIISGPSTLLIPILGLLIGTGVLAYNTLTARLGLMCIVFMPCAALYTCSAIHTLIAMYRTGDLTE